MIIKGKQLDAACISGSKVAANSILQGHYAANSISNDKLQSAVISGNAIAAGSILAGHVGANSLTNAHHQSASISGNCIATPGIGNGHISTNSINNAQLQSASISGNVIAANSIGMNHITSGTVDRDYDYYKNYGKLPRERWYTAGSTNASAYTTGSPAIAKFIALPFISGRGGVVSKIGVGTSSGNGVCRLGIYDNVNDELLYPNNLIADSGEIGITGGAAAKTANINAVLKPNQLYWLTYLAGTKGPTINCLNLANVFPIFGIDNTLGVTPGFGIILDKSYSALPNPFTAGGGVYSGTPIPSISVFYQNS